MGCGEKEREFTLRDILWSATWSPNDQSINIGGNSGYVYWFSGSDYSLKDTIPTPETISNLAWDPSGDLLVVSTQTSLENSYLIDVNNMGKKHLDSLYSSGARGISWKSDGSKFALGDNEGRVLIYDRDGNFIKAIKADPKSITGLDWHPNQNILVTVGSRIEIIDLDNDTSSVIIPREEEVLLLCVQWHPSGEFFVTGDYGIPEKSMQPLLQFWEPNGDPIKEVSGMKSEIRRIRWTDDGQLLAVASNMVFLFDYNGTLVRQNDLNTNLWGIDWNSSGSHLVTSSETGDIYILNDKLKVVKKLQ